MRSIICPLLGVRARVDAPPPGRTTFRQISYVILLALGLAAVSGRAQSGGTNDAPGQGAKLDERGPKRAERVWTRTDGVKLTGVFVARHGSVLALKEAGGKPLAEQRAAIRRAERHYHRD